MSKLSLYQNEIYYDFLSIEDRSYNEKIRFVEQNWKGIEHLGSQVSVEIFYDYIIALTELEKHHAVIPIAQRLLELVIKENILSLKGKDVYRDILFKKGIALCATKQLDEAEHITKELIKMDRENHFYKKLWLKIKKMQRRDYTQKILATSIAFFLLSGATIAIELLFVRIFYNDHVGTVELSRNLMLFIGVGLYAGYNLKNHLLDIQRLKSI